jgi:hypothetical protein
MKNLSFLFFTLIGYAASGQQALSTINFNYQYNPQNEVQMEMHLVKGDNRMKVFYIMQGATKDAFTLTWERRDSYSQKEGTPLTIVDSVFLNNDKEKRGMISVPLPAKPWILCAKLEKSGMTIPYYYIKLIENNYPVNGWVANASAIVSTNYLTSKTNYQIFGAGSRSFFVSYYNTDFPAASPPFTEKEGRVDRFLFHDSLYQMASGSTFQLKKPGLYLFQNDTASSEGFAFRAVHETFPKFTKIEDLAKPLIYVTTLDEYNEIQDAGGDKIKFDKVVLDITRDKDRARNFMRSYFRKVELANLYYSSYKEGWKTDRGMIYLVFGLPDEVTKNPGSETWFYKTYRTRFTFVKSGSVYNPENYVLLRDNRFMEPWYTAIDLWRKSRF